MSVQQLEDQFHQIVEKRTQKVVAHLGRSDELSEAIHDARRELKKIRATWRLLRDAIGKKAYKRKNRFYRDIARRLAPLRDADAVLEALAKLREYYGEVLYQDGFDKVAAALEQEKEQEAQTEDGELLAVLTETVEEQKSEINDFALPDDASSALVKGLTREYRQGYEAFWASVELPDPEVLHDWRKRAKNLRYQFDMLIGTWRRIFKAYEKELHRLTDLLGDYQDLEVLKATVARLDEELNDITQETYTVLAAQRQAKLYEKALALGRKLYAEPPQAFARRIQTYLQADHQ